MTPRWNPIDKELSRRLKRALADEQNEVLDRLRRVKPKGVDDVLPAPDEHAGRWSEVVAGGSGRRGHRRARPGPGAPPASVDDLAAELAESLTAPLRERIDRSFAASDGNLDDVADRVRALYREWKGQRLAETRATTPPRPTPGASTTGCPRAPRWMGRRPGGGPCPDCDDNVLGGVFAKGSEFPTGHQWAPAHPGCRCLVVAANR